MGPRRRVNTPPSRRRRAGVGYDRRVSPRTALLFSCFFALAGCGDDTAAPADDGRQAEEPPVGAPALDPLAPDVTGPYGVGITTLEIQSEGRTVPVEVWYPAHPAAGATVESYALALGSTEIARLPSPLGAVRDAELALEGAPHPAILFSHGHTSWPAQSFYLTEHLASHGFVVIAPEHVGDSLSGIQVDAALSLRQRPTDLTLALDEVVARSGAWPGLLYLAVDPARVGVAGHSFGATTALRFAGAELDPAATAAACAEDPDAFVCDGWSAAGVPARQGDARARAVLALGPLGTEPLGAGFGGTVAIPAMMQGGTHDTITPPEVECIPPYEAFSSPAWLVLVEGAGHFTFSSVCDFLDSIGTSLAQLDDGCTDEDIASADAHAITSTYATAFFKSALEGDATVEPWLGGASKPPLVARFERK